MISRFAAFSVFAALAFVPFSSFAGPSAETSPPSILRRIRTGQPAEVYEPGRPIDWRLTLSAPSETAPLAGARLHWTLSAWPAARDSSLAGEIPVDVPAGEHVLVPLSFTPARLGWHELALEVRDSAGALLDRQIRTLVVGMTPRSTGKHFRYGLCSHMRRQLGTPLFDRELALADRLGVDMIRTELASWDSVQPSETEWNWSTSDRVLDALEPLGIEVQSILAYSTRWGSTGDPAAKDWNEWGKAAPRLEPWLAYVHATLDRYRGRIRHWEIWNEPDIDFWRSPTADYIRLFDASSALIKKTAPQALVLNGGLALIRRGRNPDFVTEFTTRAEKTHWDIFAYHDYHTFAQFLTRRAEAEAPISAVRPDIPVWINEGGFHSLLAGGEREQAITLVKKLATAPARGIGAYFWYNLRDDGLSPRDPEHHFGLTFHDGQPKPAYGAYQALIRELGAARYRLTLSPSGIPEGAWAHLYELSTPPLSAPDAPTHTLVLWQEGAARHTPAWLGTGTGARVVGVKDFMGNPADATLADQGAALTLSREPVYVHLRANSGQLPGLTLRSLLDAPPALVLVPGATATFEIGLQNPLSVPVTARLSFDSDLPGLDLPSKAESQPLAADSALRRTIRLRVPAAPISTETPGLFLRLSIPEAGLDMPARIPLVVATSVPELAAGEEISSVTPLARLERQTDIHNLYSAEPNRPMQWHGPEDLSAVARIARDADALRLEVVVRDDTHHQTDLADNLWSADSLQVGIRTAETASGYIELGLALDNQGRSGGWVFSTQENTPLPLGRLDPPVAHSVVRDQATAATTYRLSIPWTTLGAAGPLRDGFRLTFIVNDNDGKGRKQWVKLTDGLGDQKTPDQWRVFSCR